MDDISIDHCFGGKLPSQLRTAHALDYHNRCNELNSFQSWGRHGSIVRHALLLIMPR